MNQLNEADHLSESKIKYDNLLQYNQKLEEENNNLKEQCSKQQLGIQTQQQLLQEVEWRRKLEAIILEKDNQIRNLIKCREDYIGRLSQNLIELKKLEQTVKDKDIQIIQLNSNLIAIRQELSKLKSIEVNEKMKYKSNIVFNQQSDLQNNQMDIEGNKSQFNNKSNIIKEKDYTLEYYISQNKCLIKDYQNLLIQQKNFDQLSNQIKDYENKLSVQQLILQNINTIISKLKSSNYNNNLSVELNQIYQLISQGMQNNYINKYLKCCDGQNQIVNCKQMSCTYHINCLYPKLIRQEQLEMNNCDCGQPFPYSILRKVNQVEAKCFLDQILEHQLQKIISKMRKDQRFLLYQCPNLFCNFQWCFRPNNSSPNEGSLSYCPNCQMNTQSEIIQS